MLIFVILITCIVGINSCKKGDTGPAGSQGIQGIQGVKGENGSVIFSGTAVPDASIGVNGDYYFRTNTGVLFGPKSASGWGAGVNLKGATGAAGSQFLSGTVIPAVSVGKVGDFYFNTNQMIMYGPKTSSGWGAGVNLKGATGTANVIYSGWMNANRFKDSTIDNTVRRIGHIYTPRLTSAIISSGVVLVYLNFGGGTFPLPYSSNAANKISTIDYFLKSNEIVVSRYTHDGTNSVSLSTALSYRFVIIPGGVLAKLERDHIDLNNPILLQKALNNLND